jgi:simple sugar transport system substrate-binding protein
MEELMRRREGLSPLLLVAVVFALVLAACSSGTTTTTATATTAATTTTMAAEPFNFGMILVGPQNDRGWSQANYEGGQYVESHMQGAHMIVLDKVNPSDRPGTTVEQVVDDMINQGAQLVFATSDDMKDGILAAAAAHPDVPMIWTSGDSAWKDGKAYAGLDNLGNIMGQMIYGKMIAGCAAALTTQTGSIAYLGPLANDETRRLTDSVYLGAKYCWENYRGMNASDLKFEVSWIGYWFNIPGVTSDPTVVANNFFDGGADVVISGIDTTEALVVAGQRADSGETVWAIPYDFKNGCDEKPDICLGVPYFNWGPAYLQVAESVQNGSFVANWEWNPPDWSNINDPDTSAVGFNDGPGLSSDNKTQLDTFVAGMADGSINLWSGPLNFQDGSQFLADGVAATEAEIWYMPSLLEGMEGASTSS